ncbi:hypothetical protein ABZX77_05725 [Streptomyces sp. NPDC004237]|uniref:hypothetical protein n=1 Tax=Streptomyces sp. NPDC004237 TaxID=3154455 RepID=UPI0033B6C4DD
MTTTVHIGRRTTPHHPLTRLHQRWAAFQLRHSRRVQTVTFQRLHDGLPLDDPDRYALEAPTLEVAFARLPADNPASVTPADGGAAARDVDREQRLVAIADSWFREIVGPEHSWSPQTIAMYARLMADVHGCFHRGGEA